MAINLYTSEEVNLSEPNIGDEELEAVLTPLKTGWLTQGPIVGEFETDFAHKHQVEHALATTSCTTALHLILIGMGIGEGDEVIVPSYSWIATANAVVQTGARPVFADIQRESFNLCHESVANKLSDRTKAVIVVHLFGLCANMTELKKVIPDNVKIVEDAACAVGASHKNVIAGSLGNAAAFSFHPRKIITTGEGGMVCTNDTHLFEKLRTYRNHGANVSDAKRHQSGSPDFLPDFSEFGFNYRMTDIQASIGQVQLKKLEKLIAYRRQYAEFYSRELNEVEGLDLPNIADCDGHVWQSYVVTVNESSTITRNQLMAELKNKGIATRPGTVAIHLQDCYQKHFPVTSSSLTNTEYCYRNSFAIPLHNNMSQGNLKYVAETIKTLTT